MSVLFSQLPPNLLRRAPRHHHPIMYPAASSSAAAAAQLASPSQSRPSGLQRTVPAEPSGASEVGCPKLPGMLQTHSPHGQDVPGPLDQDGPSPVWYCITSGVQPAPERPLNTAPPSCAYSAATRGRGSAALASPARHDGPHRGVHPADHGSGHRRPVGQDRQAQLRHQESCAGEWWARAGAEGLQSPACRVTGPMASIPRKRKTRPESVQTTCR